MWAEQLAAVVRWELRRDSISAKQVSELRVLTRSGANNYMLDGAAVAVAPQSTPAPDRSLQFKYAAISVQPFFGCPM